MGQQLGKCVKMKQQKITRNWIAAIAVFYMIESTFGATIRVDHESSTNGPGTAPNWSNAFDNLEDALSNSTSNDEIWVADGIYYPTAEAVQNVPRSVTFKLKAGARLMYQPL